MSTDPVDVEVKQTSIQQSNCLLFAHISNFNLKVSQQLDNLRKFKIASETATRSQRIGEFFTDRLRCMLEKINFSEIPSIVRSLLYLMVFESWGMSHEKPLKKWSAQSHPISLGINSSWYHGATVVGPIQLDHWTEWDRWTKLPFNTDIHCIKTKHNTLIIIKFKS